MKLYRVHIKGWSASFRYPIFISGFQPTLAVPPLSTIYGLLSAAKGNIVTPKDVRVGYVFKSKGKAIDLETIYELSEPLKAKSNVCKRELLFEPNLYLYIDKQDYATFFQKPYYPLLIGRSTELAMVNEIKEIELIEKNNLLIGGTVIPFPTEGIYGPLQALPTHFSDEVPRKAIGTRPFYILENFIQYDKLTLPFDKQMGWGVWMH
jgi:CRISPR-associated protein Cas5t